MLRFLTCGFAPEDGFFRSRFVHAFHVFDWPSHELLGGGDMEIRHSQSYATAGGEPVGLSWWIDG